MKDFSSLRKTLEFLLFLQNERQLRKTSWIGLLSLLLDDNFDITIKKEKSFECMHFFASFERLLRGGEIVQERLMQNIFLAEKCWWKTPHYFYERLFLFDGKWLFFLKMFFVWKTWVNNLWRHSQNLSTNFFTLKFVLFSENRGEMKGFSSVVP